MVDLKDIDYDEFNRLVNDDVRGDADEEVSLALRQPDVLEKWYNCLLSHKSSVEAQLAHGKAEKATKRAELTANGTRQEWLDFVATQERWRSGAIRFRNGVDVKLTEAKQLLRKAAAEADTPAVVKERNAALKRVLQLEKAIISHREAVDSADSDTSQEQADENLWKEVALS